MSWSNRFDEPIELPDGRKLRTLKEAIAWLAKEIPKKEHALPKVQTAARMVTEAAENNGPMVFARKPHHRKPELGIEDKKAPSGSNRRGPRRPAVNAGAGSIDISA
jgi:hypothetical protein